MISFIWFYSSVWSFKPLNKVNLGHWQLPDKNVTPVFIRNFSVRSCDFLFYCGSESLTCKSSDHVSFSALRQSFHFITIKYTVF